MKSRAFHDSCGQVVGDTVLKALAKMLRTHMAASMVARISGAEFIIFFGDMKAAEDFSPYQTTS
ncbi:diguanylate cyclase [Brucella sp. 6810]|nr:diguanylate cyclase [Brucella sp. 10RB9212]MRN51268.1 diguanylate cyclase [Brucella sp. 10RB9214]QNQ63315.1 diguanylate cyclase [Brucella sp. 6810]